MKIEASMYVKVGNEPVSAYVAEPADLQDAPRSVLHILGHSPFLDLTFIP